ncbi:UDP-glycosyltransferase 76B1 [Citrus sinensis]|uniref:UDP-glycosyltransferase 76B1 n=1 Tax=Citrus sinensis TaxID=2711 RepID=A0ACB8KIG4_CITSI|nr:UDP-glycosyltransferase 76B1 [Citrus sinensis]
METQQDPCKLPRNRRRVILFPLPFQGHINPMLQLGSILYSEGFSITIIHTTLNSPNSCNYPHFEFCSFSDDGFSETYQPSKVADDIPALLLSLNATCVVPFRDCLANKLMSNAQESKDSFACLITDAAWFMAHSVANDFKLPTIVLLTDSIAASLSYAAFPILREKGYLPIQGIIWNSFEDLEQVELTTVHQQCYLSIPVFPIGPFHKYFPAYSSSLLSQDQSSISWLDRQAPRSVIYVSFGSIAAINEIEFLEIAWGLANSRVPFLWVVRPGLASGAEWLEPLPKGFLEMVDGRGYIVKWAPQQQVLAHPAVGCFWTHSGWNSTMESICEGIPMICQPYFADQMVNSRYVSHVWRVGLHLEGKLEREEIERTIRRVMVEADGQEMRERAMYLKEKVDICLQQGGSSYQSLGRLTDHILSL